MKRRYFWYGFLAMVALAAAGESKAQYVEVNFVAGNWPSLNAARAAQNDWLVQNCNSHNLIGTYTYEGHNGTVHEWTSPVGGFPHCTPTTSKVQLAAPVDQPCPTPQGDPADNCDEPPECPLVIGEKVIKSGNGTAPSSRCDGNCSLTKSGAGITMSGGYMAWYEITGSCGTETGDGAQDNQNCLRTSSGTTYCLDRNEPDENCGTVNGEYVCLDGVPDGNCVFTAGGQAICDGGSQSGTPDDTISTDSGNDLDVFGDGNTGGTSGGSGNTSGTDDTDGDGNAGGGSGGSGTGGGEQPGDCDGSNCQGELPGANEAVDDFGTLFANFYGRVEAAPVIAAFGGIPGSLPAGSCTAVDSDPIAFLNNQVLSLDVHCSMWQEIEPILSGVMLAIWALLGGLIILRA